MITREDSTPENRQKREKEMAQTLRQLAFFMEEGQIPALALVYQKGDLVRDVIPATVGFNEGGSRHLLMMIGQMNAMTTMMSMAVADALEEGIPGPMEVL